MWLIRCSSISKDFPHVSHEKYLQIVLCVKTFSKEYNIEDAHACLTGGKDLQTVEKGQTNATNVNMPLLKQAIWGNRWKLSLLWSKLFESTFENAQWRQVEPLTNAEIYSFRSLKVHHLLQTINLNYDLKKHLPIHRGEKPHQNRFRLTN